MSELAQIEKVVFLQSVDLFAFCSADEVLRSAALAQERRYEEDEVIYREHEAADALYFVFDGEVVLKDRGRELRREARGGSFGALEILSGQRRGADAQAVSACLLLDIEAEEFSDLLSNNIEIVKALFRTLAAGAGHADGVGGIGGLGETSEATSRTTGGAPSTA